MKIPKNMKSFARFTGFRPTRLDSRFPEYNPERDYAQIGFWLDQLYVRMTRYPLDYWEKLARSAGVSLYNEDGQISREVGEAFKGVIHFLEEARGDAIGPDSEYEKIEKLEDFVDFGEAVTRMLDKSAAMPVVMSLLGYLCLDALFFATRQDSILGREGPYTMDACVPVISNMGEAIRSGIEPYAYAESGLTKSVTFALAAGMSPAEVRSSVSEQIRKISKELG